MSEFHRKTNRNTLVTALKKKKSREKNSRSMEKINSFLNKAEKNAAVLSCDIWLHK